jgi:hypothetical protein
MKSNKIKLIAALCLALGVSAFGQNNVGTLVTDPIRPFSVNSTNPSAIANEIKGGPFVSSNLVGLSNIPAPRLELGSIGYATNTGLYYRLTATNPATWSSINGANFTNIAASNIVGAVAVVNGGTGATNAATARTNLGATTIGNALFTATNSSAAIDAIGISTNFSDQVLSVSNIQIGSFPSGSSYGFVTLEAGQRLQVDGTNVTTSVPAFYGFNGFESTAFSAATARTNLGLNAWTTNTNSPVFVGTNGEVVSPTNFWQVAPIVTRFVEFDPPTNATTNIVAARNLHIHSLAISRTGVTSTIALPTTNSFNGDIALVVHQGPTSSVTAVRTAGAATNLVTLNQFDEAVEFVFYENVWQFNHNRSFIEPIYFSGTNAAANAAASITNLGLGWIDVASLTNAITFKTNLTVGGYGSGPYIGHSVQIFGNVEILAYEPSLGAGEVAPSLSVGPVEISGFTGTPSLKSVVINTDGIAFSNNASGFTRTNLGLGSTNNVSFSNVTASGTLTATSTVTAKTNLVVEGFVNYTAARTNNTPTNTPNFAAHAAWIEVKVGTNSFFLPAYK